MAEMFEISAPEGWSEYVSGQHFSADHTTRLVADDGDYLNFLKRLDLERIDPAAPATVTGWQAAEHAAILHAPDGRHWPARYAALADIHAQTQTRDAPAAETWTDRVARGRLILNLAQALQRTDQADVYRRASALITEAMEAFSGIEGEDFFRAQADVARGRLLAWKNDLIGATASQSGALSTFRKYGNSFREADAAYELAIANLDANLPDPALTLFDLAIRAHRTLNLDGAALARCLQSKARALLVKAQDGDQSLIDQVKAVALEAYVLSKPIVSASDLSPLLDQPLPVADNHLVKRDAYRAAMSARDLGAASLLEASENPHAATKHLERAKGWMMIAASELGFDHVFTEHGRQSMRQEITGSGYVRFDVLRVAQLEFEILAKTLPEEAATLLIETGKRYENQTYSIECFRIAAACFASEADRLQDQTLRNEAEYWHHRAARLALSIGARFESSVVPPESLSEDLRIALQDVQSEQACQIIQFQKSSAQILQAEIILSGRQSVSRLTLLPPDKAEHINLDQLQALSERGDIPQILESGRTQPGCLFLFEEIPVGRHLSDLLHDDLADDIRIRLGARLCRTIASLIRAHGAQPKAVQPLYITMEDIVVSPGNRCVVANYGVLGDRQAPSIGWSFLYPDPNPKSARLSDGADARALAKMLIILFGIKQIDPGDLWRASYLRRALFLKRRPMDALPLEAIGALTKLANGKLRLGKNQTTKQISETEPDTQTVPGVAELLHLAALLDNASKGA